MSTAPTRRVRTARLRGASEALVRRGAWLLEDALRTASLPAAERGRVLLIRSLSLGVIHPGKSAASVALQLERRVAQVEAGAVHAEAPQAANAPAVFFRDRLEALVGLARCLARGEGVQAWYWPLAVPGWTPDLSHEHSGRIILGHLLSLESGRHAVAQAFQVLGEHQSLDLVLGSLQERDGPVLLHRCGWPQAFEGQSTELSPIVSSLLVPLSWQRVLDEWIPRWGVVDARSLWLVAIMMVGLRPSVGYRSGVIEEAASWLVSRVPRLPAPAPAARSELRLQEFSVGPEGARLPEVPETPSSVLAGEGASVVSPHAGFLMLVPLLLRVGFDQALQERPDWLDQQVPMRILRSLAHRLAASADDPVVTWLSEEETEPEWWSAEVRAVVRQWRNLMRRWCRQQARMGLHGLVRRPGWVSVTETHVEVWMAFGQVDLRIRRAGLDLDPGWVPWLGRVIRFHYGDEGRPHGTG